MKGELLMTEKQLWLNRILSGGPIGAAIYGLFLCLALADSQSMISLLNVPLDWPNVAAGFVLSFALGAACGIATLPFGDTGRAVTLRSTAHFLLTGVLTLLLGYFALGLTWLPQLLSLAILYASLYAVIWLGRWVGWYAEAAQIREKLGLSPGPSSLKWRETLPHLGYALLLCLAMPLVLCLCDAPDVPVLTGLLYPYLLLPIGSFSAGLSLGKRQGLCPLYPVGCALFALMTVFLLFNSSALFHCAMAGLPALLGNLLGAARHCKTAARKEAEGHD